MFAWEVEVMRDTKLYVATPMSPAFPFMHYKLELAFDNAEKPKTTMRSFSNSHSVTHAREELAHGFMSMPDFTHILYLDSDILIEKDTIKRMLVLNKEIVVGRYHGKGNAQPEVFHHSGTSKYRDAPIPFVPGEEITTNPQEDPILCGMGCVLIKREVFEKMKVPYFLYSSEWYDLDDYERVSEDFYFILKAQKELNIQPVYATDVEVGHLSYCIIGGRGIALIT